MKQDMREELYGLLARIERRQAEAKEKKTEIETTMNDAFDAQQTNIEKIRGKAKNGDANAQAAYMALLRGRRMLP